MTIQNFLQIAFHATVATPAEAGVSSFTVGQPAVQFTPPGDANQIVVADLTVNVLSQTGWAMKFLEGMRFSYTTVPGSVLTTSAYFRNADGKVAYLEKIYAVLLMVKAVRAGDGDTEDDGLPYTGWQVRLENFDAIGDGSSPVGVPSINGYVDGVNGFFFQYFPEGLLVDTDSQMALQGYGEFDEVDLRLVVLGKTNAPTNWADAAVYTAGDLVYTSTSPLLPQLIYRCILGHTAVTATNKPMTGSSATSYWVLAE